MAKQRLEPVRKQVVQAIVLNEPLVEANVNTRRIASGLLPIQAGL